MYLSKYTCFNFFIMIGEHNTCEGLMGLLILGCFVLLVRLCNWLTRMIITLLNIYRVCDKSDNYWYLSSESNTSKSVENTMIDLRLKWLLSAKLFKLKYSLTISLSISLVSKPSFSSFSMLSLSLPFIPGNSFLTT